MATRKTVKTITMNGGQLTPSGDASIATIDESWEPMDNLDGSIDYKYNPERENSTFPVALDDESRKLIVDSAKNTGWSLTADLRDGSTVQLSNCAIVTKPSLDGDGAVELEIHGKVRWL
jgi:hypothetical protein